MSGRAAIGLLVFLETTGPLTAGSCVLEPGKAVEACSCSFEGRAGDYIRVVVEPHFARLSAKLIAPGGATAAEADNLQMINTLEEGQDLPLAAIARQSGVWRVEVAAPSAGEEARQPVSLRLEEHRPARPEDARRIAADRAFLAGLKKRMERRAAGYRAAVAEFGAALAIRDELGDRAARGPLLDQLGDLHARLGDLSRALTFYEQARDAYRESGNPAGEAGALGSSGQVHKIIGNLPQAIELLSQSATAFHKLGMRRHEAGVLEGLASVYWLTGDRAPAFQYHEASLQLTREEGDRRGEAVSLGNIGHLYLSIGDPEKALAYYQRSLAIDRDIGDRRNEAANLVNIGDAHRSLGIYEKALESYQQALRIQRAGGSSRSESVPLQSIGETYRDLGQPRKALEYFEKVLAIQRQADGRLSLADALNAMGACWVDLGEPLKALPLHEEALGILRGSGSRAGELFTQQRMGLALFRLGRPQEALQRNGEALEIARAIQHVSGEEQVLFERAQMHRAQGRLAEARADVEASLRIAESIRGRVAGHDSRAAYLASVYDRYSLLIDVLMQSRLQREALETAERARARGLLDSLAEARAGFRQGVNRELLVRESRLAAQLEEAGARQVRLLAGQPAPAKIRTAEEEIRKLSAEYQEVETEIRRASPRYAARAFPQPLSLDQIRKQVLDRDTVVLEYALAEPRSYVWAITAESLVAAALPSRTDIEAAVRAFYERMSNRMPVPAVETEKLSNTLLGPVAGALSARRVAVVADGALAYLPFGVLRSPLAAGGPLLAGHEVVTIPSAATLALLRTELAARPAAPKLAAVFADPVFSAADPRVRGASAGAGGGGPALERSASESGFGSLDRLPASRREARTILNLARGRPSLEAIDFQASRATALDPQLSQYRIVHFATHGLINSRHPELSGLVLSLLDRDGRPQNGFLQAHDIYNMSLGADLVVLSACRTALGKEIRGEGLVGLTRAFMYAGAPRIVASLWRVPDHATAELMARFYRELLDGHLAPAAALRRAQLELARQARYRHPYYWAGFILQGEWR